MLKKEIIRYNTLLNKFLGNEEFLDLLNLVLQYDISTRIDEKRAGIIPPDNPYERLIKDIENREKI